MTGRDDKRGEVLPELERVLKELDECHYKYDSNVRNQFSGEFMDLCWTYQDEIMAALRSARSSTRPNHFAALEKRGLYMPPGILVRLIKVANCTPREQVYPDDARYLVGVLQELTFSKSLAGPSETPPSATGEKWIPVSERLPETRIRVLTCNSLIVEVMYVDWNGGWKFDSGLVVEQEHHRPTGDYAQSKRMVIGASCDGTGGQASCDQVGGSPSCDSTLVVDPPKNGVRRRW